MTAMLAAVCRRVARQALWAAQKISLRLPPTRRFWLAVSVATLIAATVLDSVLPYVVSVGYWLTLALWARLAPRSFWRWVAGPRWRRNTKRIIVALWPDLARICNLSQRRPSRDGSVADVAPPLHTHWHHGRLRLTVQPLLGQTLEDFQKSGERVRQSYGAAHIRVSLDGGRVVISLAFTDALADVVSRPPADTAADLEVAEVTMGVTEDGQPWRLRLVGTHTLVAGCSGSGKASLVWGVSLGLAPAVHSGVVQLWGVDLKGGMELAMGRPLFSAYATEPEEAVALLEHAARLMRERAARLAGVTRQHTASSAEPFIVVLIDEVAALTAYVSDRDLKRRANDALALLCSQGRAVGFTVVACVQDPRKEVLGVRGLFPQTVGLRLRDREETSMVLGDGAVAAGAQCHSIPSMSPGVGFVVPPEGGAPVRVRAWRVDDDTIRDTAARFKTPVTIDIETARPTEAPASRRRSRAVKAEAS